jgi:hypothetical protein
MTVPELASDALGSFLSSFMRQRFESSHARLTEVVPSLARLALECIGNSDALYHNVEHTMLVTLAGHHILRGRFLLERRQPSDYAHLIVACLMHDIGYVRGILKGDGEGGYVIDASGRKVSLHRGASDAALLPHYVERSVLFVLDRLEAIYVLDAERIARAIKITRFPPDPAEEQDADEEGWLLRAADLVGQLGDPNYLRKSNALFYEFEECGLNRQLGYTSPIDIVERYPRFFYDSVAPRIQSAIKYLNVSGWSAVDRWSLRQSFSGRAKHELIWTTALIKLKNCTLFILPIAHFRLAGTFGCIWTSKSEPSSLGRLSVQ